MWNRDTRYIYLGHHFRLRERLPTPPPGGMGPSCIYKHPRPTCLFTKFLSFQIPVVRCRILGLTPLAPLHCTGLAVQETTSKHGRYRLMTTVHQHRAFTTAMQSLLLLFTFLKKEKITATTSNFYWIYTCILLPSGLLGNMAAASSWFLEIFLGRILYNARVHRVGCSIPMDFLFLYFRLTSAHPILKVGATIRNAAHIPPYWLSFLYQL